MKRKTTPLSEYDRAMLRSAFVSLFWNVIKHKKGEDTYTLRALAEAIGVNKSAPSRWFSEDRPNWTVNTISDIAAALDIELELFGIDRSTGMRFAPHGIVSNSETSAPAEIPDAKWTRDKPAPPRTESATKDHHRHDGFTAESVLA